MNSCKAKEAHWRRDALPSTPGILIQMPLKQKSPGRGGPAEASVESGIAIRGLCGSDFLLLFRCFVGIVVGLLANTCVEGTSRFAAELGYRVTLVTDATAAFGADGMHAAHVLNGPTYAHELLTSSQVVTRLSRAS